MVGQGADSAGQRTSVFPALKKSSTKTNAETLKKSSTKKNAET